MPALLFDIGNVLVTFDFTQAIARLAERSSVGKQGVIDAIEPIKQRLESGTMSEDEFVFRAMDQIDFEGTGEQFREIWSDIFAANAPMAATLATVPESLPMYLLSNTNGLHLRWLKSKFAIFKHFSGGVYSHEAKCMKPQDAIYQQAIRQFGLDPAQTVYVDDLEPNIVTGRKLGFQSYHYAPARHDDFHQRLQAWLAQVRSKA